MGSKGRHPSYDIPVGGRVIAPSQWYGSGLSHINTDDLYLVTGRKYHVGNSCKSQVLPNRTKNILSALSGHGEVTTTSDPINYIYPSVKLVDSVTNPYPEDWRLKVQPDEQQYTGDLTTIDLLYEKTPQYFVNKYQNVLSKLQINPDILNFVDNFTFPWEDMVGVHIRSWYCERRKFHDNTLFETQIDRLPEDQIFSFVLTMLMYRDTSLRNTREESSHTRGNYTTTLS